MERMQVFRAFRTVRSSQKQESDAIYILQTAKFYNFETSRFSFTAMRIEFRNFIHDRNNWFTTTFDVKFNVRFDL